MASFTLEAPREYVRQQLQSLGIQDISEADLESYTSGKLCGPLLVCTRVRASTSHAQIDKHTNLCVRIGKCTTKSTSDKHCQGVYLDCFVYWFSENDSLSPAGWEGLPLLI